MSKQPGGNGPKGPEDKFGSFSELNEKLAAEREAELAAEREKLLETPSKRLGADLGSRYMKTQHALEIISFLDEQRGIFDSRTLLSQLHLYSAKEKSGAIRYQDVDLLANSGFGAELEKLFLKNEFNEIYEDGKALVKKVWKEVSNQNDLASVMRVLNNSVNDWKNVTEKLPKKLADKFQNRIFVLFGMGGKVISDLLKRFPNKQNIDIKELRIFLADQLFLTENELLDSLLVWKKDSNAPVVVRTVTKDLSESEMIDLENNHFIHENELAITEIDPQKLLIDSVAPLLKNGCFEKSKVDVPLLVEVLRDRYRPIFNAEKGSSVRKGFFDVLAYDKPNGSKINVADYQEQLSEIKSVFDGFVKVDDKKDSKKEPDKNVKSWLSGTGRGETPLLSSQLQVLSAAKKMLDIGDRYFKNWLFMSIEYYKDAYKNDPNLAGKSDFSSFLSLWNSLWNSRKYMELNAKDKESFLSKYLSLEDQQKIGELIESEDEHKWSALESLFRRKFNLPDKKDKSAKPAKTLPAKKETTPAPVPETTNAEMPEVVLSPENEAQAEKIKVLIKSLADEDFPLLPAIFGKFDFKNKNEYWDELVTRIRPEDYPALVEMLEILETIGERFNKTIDLGFSSGSIGNLDKIFFGDESFKKLFVIDPKDKITIIFDKASLDAWQKLYTRYVNKFLKLLEDPLFPEVKENLKLNLEELVNNDGKINEQLLNAALSELKKIKKAQVGPEEKK